MVRSHLLAPIIAAVFLVPSFAAAAGSCLTASCHPAVISAKIPHDPVKGGECLACHKQDSPPHPTPGRKGFSLVARGEKLCAPCHETPGAGLVVHQPFKAGECLSCHQPHGADNEFLLKGTGSSGGLCLGCHDSSAFTRLHVHAPVATGGCSSCHDPHRSAEKGLLKGPVNSLCFNCHIDIKELISSSKIIHPPIKVAGCISCHDPHSSANLNLGVRKMPELCFECHKTIESQIAKVKQLHKPLTQERGCGACHSPHASNIRKLLSADEKALCLGCHGDNSLAPLKNIAEELKGKTQIHGPIALGRCTGCHDPHGSNNFRLLIAAYPATYYAPYADGTYALCLKCHEKNLLHFAETTVYTKFRNGKRNLHYVHVVNNRKGRSCRACHEPHAANGPKLTSTVGSSFGEWKIPFNLVVTETGGSCASGCHKSLSYDRLNPVEYHPAEKAGSGTPPAARQGAH